MNRFVKILIVLFITGLGSACTAQTPAPSPVLATGVTPVSSFKPAPSATKMWSAPANEPGSTILLTLQPGIAPFSFPSASRIKPEDVLDEVYYFGGRGRWGESMFRRESTAGVHSFF
jgi:hypothetical protein